MLVNEINMRYEGVVIAKRTHDCSPLGAL